MAKVKNKIVNNRLKHKAARQVEIFQDLKGRMQKLVEEEDYVAAMDVMAEMAANKKIDAEVMYLGAMCYFRTGDYARAAKWLNDAITYAGAGAREKILLSGICIGDGRYEDGMKVMESVLCGNNEKLSPADKEFMRGIVRPLAYGYDDLLVKYPQVRDLVQEGEQIAFGLPVDKGEKNKASTALAKLKAILNKNKQESGAENTEEKPKQEPMADEQAGAAIMAEKRVIDGTMQADADVDGFDTAGKMQQVMASAVSLQAKIKMLNAFAAGCYQSGNYQAAFDLLNGALQLDAYAPEVLKNMAYVCLSAGEKEQALEYAAKLPMADFGLLYALKHS